VLRFFLNRLFVRSFLKAAKAVVMQVEDPKALLEIPKRRGPNWDLDLRMDNYGDRRKQRGVQSPQ